MTRHTHSLNTPNGPLPLDIYRPAAARGASVVVACHGFKGFKDWGFWPATGRRFAEAGIALVTFNVSGSGIGDDPETFTELDRFAENTLGKELQDLGAVLDAVSNRELPLGDVDIRRLGLLGHSRGGGIALIRASRDPRVRALVTWAAVAAFDRFDEETERIWRERGYVEVPNTRTGQVFRMNLDFLDDLRANRDTYDPVAAARRLRIPSLFIHGTRDESVPADEAQQLSRAADPGYGRLALIQGAGHTFGATHPFSAPTEELLQVWEKSLAWFEDGLSLSGGTSG